jgi:putative hydrolase of the HAD superfamily
MQGKVYIKNYIFDLDETLYNPKVPIMRLVSQNIDLYMKDYLNLKENDIKYLRNYYKKEYGTTLAGLMAEYKIDSYFFLQYVHNINYSHYLKEDPLLLNILSRIDGRLAVFTNASKKHATDILNLLGIAKLFNNIVSIEDVDFIPKPKLESFNRLLQIINITPEKSLFIDNMQVNLQSAKKLKMKTALVWDRKIDEDFDYSLTSIYDIINII